MARFPGLLLISLTYLALQTPELTTLIHFEHLAIAKSLALWGDQYMRIIFANHYNLEPSKVIKTNEQSSYISGQSRLDCTEKARGIGSTKRR